MDVSNIDDILKKEIDNINKEVNNISWRIGAILEENFLKEIIEKDRKEEEERKKEREQAMKDGKVIELSDSIKKKNS